MADASIFVGWHRPVVGREAQGVECFGKFLALLGKTQASGHIESFEPVFLGLHGGDLNGFVLIRGQRDKLDAFKASDAFLDILTEADHCMQGMGVIDGWIGAGVQQQMGRFQKHITP